MEVTTKHTKSTKEEKFLIFNYSRPLSIFVSFAIFAEGPSLKRLKRLEHLERMELAQRGHCASAVNIRIPFHRRDTEFAEVTSNYAPFA